MTTPPPQAAPAASPTRAPTGVRVASTICWVVGVITVLVAISVGIPALSTGTSLIAPAINLTMGLLVCVAAVLVRRQRRLGVLLVVIAWATPFVIALIQGLTPSGSFLMFAAMLVLLANWKHMR